MKETLDRGVTFDPETGEFAIWQTFPKALKQDVNVEVTANRIRSRVKIKTVVNRAGRKMLKLEGTFQNVTMYQVRGLLIALRGDFSEYIKGLLVAQRGEK